MIITCEHAGNEVPEAYQHLFIGHEETLQSHRGWDPGAVEIATHLAQQLKVPLFKSMTTRLLVETNRSLNNEDLFSGLTSFLSQQERERILALYYHPYRNAIEEALKKSGKPVLHISMHSFTPVLDDQIRELEVGLLFDPQREIEADFSRKFQHELQVKLPGFRIELNKPYRGTDDGLTTHLRTKFSPHTYLGIEIEVNQKLRSSSDFEKLKEALTEGLRKLQ